MGLDKRNFLVYAHWWSFFQSLPDDRNRAKLFDAMCGYALDGEIPSFSDLGETAIVLEAFFTNIRQQLDADSEHYKTRCELNRANGQKGGHAKAANQAIASESYQSLDSGCSEKQSVANLADTDIEHDTDLGNEPGVKRITGSNPPVGSFAHSLDLKIVAQQIQIAYKKLETQGKALLPMDDAISVFNRYYEEYSRVRGQSHPRLSQDNIEKAVKALLYCESDDGQDFQMCLDEYEGIIPTHFQTNYPDCNYSIMHFLNGRIRYHRLNWQEGVTND
jgi:hypothetical protein